MFRLFKSALLAAFVLFSVQGVFAQASRTDIVDRVLDRYAGLETLQARFTQTMTSTIFEDEREVITGSLLLKGESYRILTGNRTIVTDGETSWIYDAVENQVLIDHQLEDEFTFSVHQFLYRFDERFSVEGVTQHGDGWHIALSPRDELDYFRNVELEVRGEDAIITGVKIVDANDVHLDIQLRDIQKNPALAPDLFSFAIPESADVVDLRAN